MKAIDAAMAEVEAEQEHVSAETCIPAWAGERMDDDLVVAGLFELTQQTLPGPGTTSGSGPVQVGPP